MVTKKPDRMVLFTIYGSDDECMEAAKQWVQKVGYNSRNVSIERVQYEGEQPMIQVRTKSPLGSPLWLIWDWAMDRGAGDNSWDLKKQISLNSVS